MLRALFALLSIIGLNLPVTTLDEKPRVFPRDVAAPRSVVIVTFTKTASTQGSQWSRRLDAMKGKVPAEVFQVAVLEDVPRLFRSMAVSGIAKQIPDRLRDHFWIATEGGKDWKRCVGDGPAGEAFLFVLDGRSQISWRAHGACTEAKVQELLTLPPPP
jgi:hypothetical protein